MSEIAQLAYEEAAEVDWSGAAIPVRPERGLAVFRLKATKRGKGIATALDLPGTTKANQAAAWVGPGEWLIFAAIAERERVKARLAEQQEQGAGYWSELGDGLVILDIGDAQMLVSRLTGLPESALRPGRAARTRLAGIAVLFVGTAAGVRMIFDRAYDRHVRAWLDRAL